jgi:toxin YoeB
MAKRVVWSLRAQSDRKDILKYWNQRNKSKAYSIKLNSLIKEAVELVARYPKIGKETDKAHVRVKVVRDYLIIYEEAPSQIEILTNWDSRQDPDQLDVMLE